MASILKFTGSSLLITLIILVVINSGCLKTGEDYTQLRIDTIDIAAIHVKSSYAYFNVTVYLENYGKIENKNASLLLKAYNNRNGLLETQIKTSVDRIDPGKMVIIPLSLMLPRKGGYNLQLELYENGVRKATRSASISNLESLEEDVKDIGIEIGEMDFLVRNTSKGKVVIETDIYFSNEGMENSSEFNVQVKARESDAQLIADKKWIHLEAIKPETTIAKSVNLTVPNQNNYKVEVLIWSKDTIVKRGEGSVLLLPAIKLQEGEHLESRSIDVSEFKSEIATKAEPATETEKASGFEILASLMMLTAGAWLGRRKFDGR